MAVTDPNNTNRIPVWSFKEWLGNVTGGFFGPNKTIVPAGGTQGISGDLPPEAKVARQRYADKYKGSAKSRMEEAKEKQQVWENNLEKLVLDRLAHQFHPENYARMKLQPSLWTNQLRRIIEDVSMLYTVPARRSLDTEEDEAEKKQQTQGDMPGQDKPALPDTTKPKAPPPAIAAKADPTAPPAADAPPVPPGGPQTGEPDIDALAEVLDLDGEDKKKPKVLDIIAKMIDFDVYLDLVEKMVRFQDCVWVRPIVRYERTVMVQDTETGLSAEQGDTKTGKLSLVLYTPANADVVENPENPAEALAWYYWANELMPNGQYQVVIHYFDKDKYWKFNHEWKKLQEPIANPYKRLPVAVFRKELPSPQSYYVNGSGRDLFEATLELCVLRTIQNARFRDSGFKQLAFTGDDQSINSDIVLGGPAPVMLPDGGTATVLDMQPNLQPMTDLCESRQLEQAGAYGMSPDGYKMTAAPQSGFAKKLDQKKLLKENKRIRKFFAESEQDLYSLLAIVLKESPIDGVPELNADDELTVDFGEPEYEEDPKIQAMVDAQDIDLNLTSIVEILKRRNPDLDEVELVEMAYKNRRINDALITPAEKTLWDLMGKPVPPKGAGGAGGAGGGGFGGGGGSGGPPPGAP